MNFDQKQPSIPENSGEKKISAKEGRAMVLNHLKQLYPDLKLELDDTDEEHILATYLACYLGRRNNAGKMNTYKQLEDDLGLKRIRESLSKAIEIMKGRAAEQNRRAWHINGPELE